jgi:hypothetical protein
MENLFHLLQFLGSKENTLSKKLNQMLNTYSGEKIVL